MAKVIIGLFEDADTAEAVAMELTEQGVPSEDIGLVARDEAEDAARPTDEGAGGDEGADGTEAKRERAKQGAKKGAVAGGVIGGAAGVAAAVAGLSIPGIGPILAAGPIAAALAGAGVGAATGGLIGALTKMGVPEREAHHYAEGVRRGGVLVTVRADDDAAEAIAIVLGDNGALDVDRLAEDWRAEGWTGFEPDRALPGRQERLRADAGPLERGRVYAPLIDVPAQEQMDLQQQRGKAERRRPQTSTRYDGPERRQPAQA